jgi:hypothetical protein
MADKRSRVGFLVFWFFEQGLELPRRTFKHVRLDLARHQFDR